MADAEARYVITLDSGPLKAGARSGASALEYLRQRIQMQQKALDGLRASMQRLSRATTVVRFQQIPKDLEKALGEAKKLGTELAKIQKKQAENNAKGFSDVGLKRREEAIRAQFGGVTGNVKRLLGEQAKLSTDPAVKAFLDQKARAGELEAELANLQTQYDGLGGSAEELKEPFKNAFDQATEGLQRSGGPLGQLAGGIRNVKELWEKGGWFKTSVIAAGVVGLVVLIGTLALKIGQAAAEWLKFGANAADASRSAGIKNLAATGGSVAGLRVLDATIAKIRANTAATKEDATKLATSLYREGLRGGALQNAALTIERFGVLGEETRGQVEALYKQLQQPIPSFGFQGVAITRDMLPRDQFLRLATELGKDGAKALRQGALVVSDRGAVANALFNVGAKDLARPAREQMRSLAAIAQRLDENIKDLFSTVNIGPFLAALNKVANLLDGTTASGKNLRKVVATIFQPFASAASFLLPLVEGALEGVVFMVLAFYLAALKARNGFLKMLPPSVLATIQKLVGDMDMAEVGFYLAIAAVTALTAGLTTLGIVLAATATLFAALTAPIWLPFVLAAAAAAALIYTIYKLGKAIATGDWASLGDNIITGLVNGITGGVPKVQKGMALVALAARKSFAKAIDAHSPARKFIPYGHNITQGIGVGVEQGTEDLQRQVDESAPDAPRGGEAIGGGTRASVTVNGGVHVHAHFPNVREVDDLKRADFKRTMIDVIKEAIGSLGAPQPRTT